MKKLLKAIGLAALVAGMLPYRIEQSKETGERTFEALLWQVRTLPNPETGRPKVSAVSIIPNRLAREYGKAAAAESTQS